MESPVEYVWITLGAILIVYALLDAFFTVLNYNENGLLVNRLIGAEWALIRTATSRASGNLRRFIYRQTTGIIFVSVIMWWAAAIIIGFALIFYGGHGLGALRMDNTAPRGMLGALYFSAAQFTSVGVADIAPKVGWIGILSVAETFIGVILLSMIITFLFNIYTAIQALRTLCIVFPSVDRQVTSPLETLRPFFSDGVAAPALEAHLATVRNRFNSYFDTLAQDHLAYYFQSGQDRFSLPFAVFQVAGTWESLWVGLPSNAEAANLPELQVLSTSLIRNQRQIFDRFKWVQEDAPVPVSSEEFHRQMSGTPTDPQLIRLRELQLATQETTGIRGAPLTSVDYDRYVHWLCVRSRVDQMLDLTSKQLGYRPTLVPAIPAERVEAQRFGWIVTPLTSS